MRVLALIALVLVAPTTYARTGRFERTNSRTPQGRSADRGFMGEDLAWFEFAPASGAGLPTAANLCDTLQASEKVGNWWCLNGDGTMASGSAVTLTATGSPTQASQRVCPSGNDCASRTVTNYGTNATNYIEPSNAAFPASDFTACVLTQVPPLAAAGDLLSFGTSTAAANFSARPFEVATSGAVSSYISNGAAASTLAWGVSVTTNARHLLCYTYQRVGGAANNVQRTYLDGTAAATNSTANLAQALSSKWSTNGNGASLPGCVGCNQDGAFVTYSVLSAARIAAIARAVLADAPTGARGEALTLTRASVQFCESSDGTGSLLPNNRLCVTRGGTTAAQGSFVQSLTRTEEIDDAAWTKNGIGGPAAPVVTQNYAVSPGGTLTAERVQISACPGGSARSDVIQAGVGAASTTHIGSVWLAATSGTQTVSLCTYGASGVCTQKTLTTTPQRYVTAPFTSSGDGVVYLAVGCINQALYTGATNTGAADILMWGANITPGSSLRPYIPATSATVTTAAEVPYFTLTSAPALNSIEATVDIPASLATNATFVDIYKDATNYFQGYINNLGKLGCFFYVGGVAYEGQSAGSVTYSSTQRLSCSYDGTNVIACVAGTCTSTAKSFTMFSAATRLYVGSYHATTYEFSPSPVIKGIKADPSPTRFR